MWVWLEFLMAGVMHVLVFVFIQGPENGFHLFKPQPCVWVFFGRWCTLFRLVEKGNHKDTRTSPLFVFGGEGKPPA